MVERNYPDSHVPIMAGSRTWLVQRHYIALHGLKSSELPKLKFPEIINDKLYLSYIYDDGGILIQPNHPDYANQTFIHTDLVGQTRHFHVAKLASLIRQSPDFPLEHFPADATSAAHVMANNGIEEDHFARMTDEFLNEPGIICVFDDDTQLIADGNHRLVKRARLNLEFMSFWMVPETIWRRVLLMVPDGFLS